MLIDTHCHIDCTEFDADRGAVLARAREAGVACGITAAGWADHFERTREVALSCGWAYAVGTHPLWTNRMGKDDIARLRDFLAAHIDEPALAAVGEIGIDGFDKTLSLPWQEEVLVAQLKVARDFDLPVVVHSRHAVDLTLKCLRRVGPFRGTAHAFNGSEQQAAMMIGCGLKLGFGGACTYSGSKRIRRLLAQCPADSWVLETDCPDMPAAWRRNAGDLRSEPADIARVAQEAAGLRGISLQEAVRQSGANALAAFPRLAAWMHS